MRPHTSLRSVEMSYLILELICMLDTRDDKRIQNCNYGTATGKRLEIEIKMVLWK
jgi:hypothetical protein